MCDWCLKFTTLFWSEKKNKNIPCSGTKNVNHKSCSGVTTPSLKQNFVLHCIALDCILFYSIYSILLHCILLRSILFYCILFYTILLHSILLYYILFYSIVFCCVVLYSIFLFPGCNVFVVIRKPGRRTYRSKRPRIVSCGKTTCNPAFGN